MLVGALRGSVPANQRAFLSVPRSHSATRWRFGHSNEAPWLLSRPQPAQSSRLARPRARAPSAPRPPARPRSPPRAPSRRSVAPAAPRRHRSGPPARCAPSRARLATARDRSSTSSTRTRGARCPRISAPRRSSRSSRAPRCSDGAAWTSRVTSPGSDSWAPFSSSSSRTPSRPYPTTRERNRSRRSSAPPPARASPPPPSPSSSTTTGATSGTGCCPQPWSTRRPAGTTGRCT